MRRIVSIGGSGRGAGKTAVGCALIKALPEFRWTAIKVTSHWHAVGTGVLELAGTSEEFDLNSDKDTSRYLAAGAAQAWLVTGVGRSLENRMEVLAAEISGRDAILLECGRGLDENLPSTGGAGLLVLGPAPDQWKPVTEGRLSRADAILFPESLGACRVTEWLSTGSRTKLFSLPEKRWLTRPLVDFVRGCLESS